MHRRLQTVLCLGVAALLAGCQDIDWNWNLTWWKQPRRVVRPRPAAAPAEDRDETRLAEQSESRQREAAPPGGSAQNDAASVDSVPAEPAAAPRATADTGTPPAAAMDRAYFNLYLVSDGSSARDGDAETRMRLRNTLPGRCARVLEMLYVPVGRSGSSTESFLIYEDRRVFEAAREFVPFLDVPAIMTSGPTVGAEAAFRNGVGLLQQVLDVGVMVPPELIDACEARLAEAVQSSTLSSGRRWAAGILAGRLMAEYRYDYSAARSYYRQAERQADPRSVEAMVAQWWRAESLSQDGRHNEAATGYREIESRFGALFSKSQIVRRSRAMAAAVAGR